MSKLNPHEDDMSIPESLRGKRDEVRLQSCQKCDATWSQKCGDARRAYKMFDQQMLCGSCKRAYKHMRSDLITVTCQQCEREYQVTPQGHYAAIHRRGGHTCKSCVNKGKVLGEEHKQKISQANKGRKLDSVAKLKISLSSKLRMTFKHASFMSKRSSHGRGRTQSPSERALRSRICKNIKRTEQWRKNIGAGRRTYLKSIGGVSPETRAKIAARVIEARLNGFKPETKHKHEYYTPVKPQFVHGSVVQPKKMPYFLSSSWESLYARSLDLDPDVVSWTYEAVRIPFAGTCYIPDFIWLGVDGRVRVVEVKPAKKFANNVARARDKFEACRAWCAERGWIAGVVTECELF